MNNYAVERTTPTSPQHGSPDSDKFFPGPYHPPFPSPTPESSSELDSDSESLLTSLQRHTVYWSRPPGGVKLRPEYFVLRDENSTLPTTLPASLPAMPSLSETQEEDSQVLNLPPSPDCSQSKYSQLQDSELPSGQGEPAFPDPSQPEDTQLPSSQGETDTGADEYDGWIRFGFIKAVKTVVHHLLYNAIEKYMHDKWNGCSTGRPSLSDPERWEHLEDGFFERNYKGVMRLLCNARFFDAVQRFLVARNIHQDNDTVNAVAQAYLYELTMVKRVHDHINEVYNQLVEENYELKDQLEAITQYWQGS
ncbi:uncharacterized protein LOC118561315 [Fundulus heteroclitus]|uniref:uncharacterized protein LOC118561314 n=1 Tax=Fundulus heteroclitus TaxID=8078 RepID=UPI00165B1790|nr:uncharacterized protein LOC118561314 [Fundulus heteroclitus]XP_035989205.1 uncharacterized protein LOC118561314 [Fundulus heteroclitus]XP_035989206.1 uncharacterized protein LOC118561314 [Fundulus heteroclitus]XP_035989207.1 uncharacterized protein LOC118561315 [Fundulus heteroclitus]XP_035989208.1 uncharacterized protein LOC118561315 [Fundulus heteroclitus]